MESTCNAPSFAEQLTHAYYSGFEYWSKSRLSAYEVGVCRVCYRKTNETNAWTNQNIKWVHSTEIKSKGWTTVFIALYESLLRAKCQILARLHSWPPSGAHYLKQEFRSLLILSASWLAGHLQALASLLICWWSCKLGITAWVDGMLLNSTALPLTWCAHKCWSASPSNGPWWGNRYQKTCSVVRA